MIGEKLLIKNAREALEREENIVAMILADQALEGLLRDLCIKHGCDDQSYLKGKNGSKKPFLQWNFTDYMKYLIDKDLLTHQEKINFYKFHKWRNLAQHHDLEPSTKTVDTVINTIEDFTKRQTLSLDLNFSELKNLEDQGKEMDALQLYYFFYLQLKSKKNDEDAKICINRILNLAINHDNHEIRRKAVSLIRKIGDTKTTPALIQIYKKEPNIDVRVQALRAISSQAHEEELSLLIAALDYEIEKSPSIRVRAAIELRRLEFYNKDNISGLLKALLHDPDPGVQRRACMALCKPLQDERIRPSLISIVKDKKRSTKVRKWAIQALIYYPGEEVVEILKDVLNNEVGILSKKASTSLVSILSRQRGL